MAKRGRAAVVVLGDLGRSPRMQYHALSLAEQAELQVDVVAHAGSEPRKSLKDHPNVHLHLASPLWAAGLPRVMYLLLLPFKVLAQMVALMWTLCVTIPAPDFIIVQNPPSIPALSVVLFACWLRKSAMVIDWHNFGYTLLGLKLGLSHPFVRFYKWYEKTYGKRADAHLCVTKAMQQELATNWGVHATVLYDRSPAFFRPATLEEKHELFLKLNDAIAHPPGGVTDCCGTSTGTGKGAERAHEPDESLDGYVIIPPKLEETILSSRHMGSAAQQASEAEAPSTSSSVPSATFSDASVPSKSVQAKSVPSKSAPSKSASPIRKLSKTFSDAKAAQASSFPDAVYEEQGVALKPDRPAVIVSSTSWTPDEDFDVLLQAAIMYDLRVSTLMGETSGEGGAAAESVAPSGARSYPRLLIIVTGKGPLKAQFEERMAKLRLKRVAFRTLWLSSEDYPLLLGSADLGISLHSSSSGLDLPMKVVDMFGCGAPVCARAYSCISELVHESENGLLFSNPSELADQLLDLFRGFPQESQNGLLFSSPSELADQPLDLFQDFPQAGGELLSTLRKGATASGNAVGWQEEWGLRVLPLLDALKNA